MRLPTDLRAWWNLLKPKPVTVHTVHSGAGTLVQLQEAQSQETLRDASPQSTPQSTPHARSTPQKHCIILHGWHSTHAELSGITKALRNLPQAEGWTFWPVTYDTHWKSFRRTARELVNVFSRQPHDFSNTIFVGYSMGGIIARQMVAYGFPCKALISICSPHQGLVPWVPTTDPGTLSLAPWSRQLAQLNRNPRDAAHRHCYYFFAITYTDRGGYHDHDGIVSARSALGEDLGSVAVRQKIKLQYRLYVGFDPHWRGMDPRYLSPMLDVCGGLFSR